MLGCDKKPTDEVVICAEETEDQCGAFLVHHFLSGSLGQHQRSVVFLGLEQSIGHYHAVGLKLGNSLIKAREKGQLAFMELLRLFADGHYAKDGATSTFTVSEIIESVAAEIQSMKARRPDKGVVVIVDKLSVLLNMGMGFLETVEFVRSLLRLCAEHKAGLFTLVRSDSDLDKDEENELNFLAAYLAHNCHLSIKVWPLATGKSSSVSGNISFEWSLDGDSGRRQFRVEERTVKVFPLGASRAVL